MDFVISRLSVIKLLYVKLSPCFYRREMSGPSPRTYSFDWLFFRRLFRLHKIFFPAFLSANVCMFVLLILASISGLKLSSCLDVYVVQSPLSSCLVRTVDT